MIRPRPMGEKPVKTVRKTCRYLRPISEKRAIENKQYKIVSAEYLSEHPLCEYEEIGIYPDGTEFPIPCMNKSTQIHHKKGRVGKLLYDKRWFCAVCNTHGGSYIHDRSGDSYARGFMLPRWK